MMSAGSMAADLKGMTRQVGGLASALGKVLLSTLILLGLARMAWLTLNADDAFELRALSVNPELGQSVALGRWELAARGAIAGHLILRRDAAGNWMARSSRERADVKLRAGPDASWEPLNAIMLHVGQRIAVGDHLLDVSAVEPALRLQSAGGEWHYDGVSLANLSGLQHACSPGVVTWLMNQWARIAPRALVRDRPMELGGVAACDNRFALADVPLRSAVIRRVPGGFRLQAGDARESASVCTNHIEAHCATGAALSDLEARLSEGTSVLVGRSIFRIEENGDTLILHSVRAGLLMRSMEVDRLEPSLARDVVARDRWRIPDLVGWSALAGLLLGLTVAVALGTRYSRLHRRSPLPKLRMATVALAAVWMGIAAGGKASGSDFGWACAALGSAIALLVVLGFAWQRGGNTIPLWWGALAAVGLCLQLELSLTAPHAGGMNSFASGAALLSLAVAATILTASVCAMTPLGGMTVRHAERAVLLLISLALCALAAQAMYGGEAGVWGVQPVELAKFALTAGTAHVLALHFLPTRSNSSARSSSRWFITLLPVLLLVALVIVALSVVDDYSPLLLITFWIAGAFAAASIVAGRTMIASLLLALCVAMFVLASNFQAGLAQYAIDLGIYEDRMEVWLDPEAHPHTGSQFLHGRLLGQAGGTWGTALSKNPHSADPWQLPAVQDDFAPSYLLFRYGAVGGILVVLLQAGALTRLLKEGLDSYKSGSTSDYRTRWLALWTLHCLWGGTAFLIGHWITSWGTNLGFLPVMGQPMTLISASGSHFLFLLYPLCAIASIHQFNRGSMRCNVR